MEINITWNVCRICLQEENTVQDENGDMPSLQWRNIFTEANIVDQIYDCSGVMIKSNDSLPQKICRKCELVLKQAVYFRNTCRNSDKCLQNILEKAKSAKSMFKFDKSHESTFDDIIEGPSEDIFSSEEHLLEESESEFKDKCNNAEYPEDSINLQRRKRSSSSTCTSPNEAKRPNSEIEISKESTKSKSGESTLIRDIETVNKSRLDFSELFLTNDEDDEPELDAACADNVEKQNDDIVPFIKSTSGNVNNDQTIDNHANKSNNYFGYKTLEVTLTGDEGQDVGEIGEENDNDELIDSNLETVNIVKTDNSELFYIFSDDVISKSENDNDASSNSKDIEMLPAQDEAEDDEDESIVNIEEDNIEEYVGSEPILCTDSDDEYDEFIKCSDMSQDSKANNENDEYYEDDLLERAIMQLKPEYIKQMVGDELSTDTERKNNIMKPTQTQSRQINFYCQICGLQFMNRSLLKHHMRMHRNERTFECELCFKRFTAACNLTTHMRTHTGEKPFVCQFCERRFSDKSTQVKHERTHTDERPYSCSICQKAFTLSSSLKAHSRVHTGEKPFRCEPCGKSFKLPHQLKAHLSTNAHKTRSAEEYILPNM